MIKIAPSILSADFTKLGEEVHAVLDGGADYVHVDVMDGTFVPNITIGVPVVKSLRKEFPDDFLDVHLMIDRPSRLVGAFAKAGADLLMMHWEAENAEGLNRALEECRSLGVKTGLALRPKTDWKVLDPWLDSLDMILVMTVEPGFGGQSFMPDTLPKIRALRAEINRRNPACELEVDGGISPETSPLVIEAGANVLVAGSAVFGKGNYAERVRKIRGEV